MLLYPSEYSIKILRTQLFLISNKHVLRSKLDPYPYYTRIKKYTSISNYAYVFHSVFHGLFDQPVTFQCNWNVKRLLIVTELVFLISFLEGK